MAAFTRKSAKDWGRMQAGGGEDKRQKRRSLTLTKFFEKGWGHRPHTT
jgi:hypothetical protein